jgi:HEAT repeat protein
LGRVGAGADKVQAALEKFSKDTDPLIKLDATIALAGIGNRDDSTIPVLVAALGNKNKATTKAAGQVLVGIAKTEPDKVLPDLMKTMDGENETAAVNAVHVLKFMRTHAEPALPKLAALYDKVKPDDRIEVLEALEMIDNQGDHAIPVLIKALKAPNPEDRREALLAILKFRSKSDEFVGALAGALNDSDPENRSIAIGIVRSLGNRAAKAIPELITLVSDPDLSVRTRAIDALSSFPNDPRVFGALQNALKDKSPQARMWAIGALRDVGRANPRKAVEILQQAITTESSDTVKRAMTSALESLKTPQSKVSVKSSETSASPQKGKSEAKTSQPQASAK